MFVYNNRIMVKEKKNERKKKEKGTVCCTYIYRKYKRYSFIKFWVNACYIHFILKWLLSFDANKAIYSFSLQENEVIKDIFFYNRHTHTHIYTLLLNI